MKASSKEPRTRRVFVFLLQLGGPENLDAVEPFLRNLLEDVLPAPLWAARRLARALAARRTVEILPRYRAMGGGSPLRANTDAQAAALEAELHRRGYQACVRTCMRYAPPRVTEALAEARRDWSDAYWVALPLFPQYSFATTRTSVHELDELLTTPEQARLVQVSAYPQSPGYLDAMVACVEKGLREFLDHHSAPPHLLFSAHGVPLRLVKQGDPYPQHIEESVRGIVGRLEPGLPYSLAFQSRVGPMRWLEPAVKATVCRLAALGAKRLLVVPVAFVSEHLETLYELDIELREVAKSCGIEQFVRAPTPGTHPQFVNALATEVHNALPREKNCLLRLRASA